MPQRTQSSAVYFLTTTFRTGRIFASRFELLAGVVGSQSSSKSSLGNTNSASRSPPYQVRTILFITLGSLFETTTLFRHQFGILFTPPFASEGNAYLRTSFHVRPRVAGRICKRCRMGPRHRRYPFTRSVLHKLGADNTLVVRMLFNAFKCAATVTEKDQPQWPASPRRRANRAAHLLRPPLRLMKSRSGSSGSLNSAAYRNTRDHLLRVLLSTFSRSAVQRITAANGSGSLTEEYPAGAGPDKRP